MKHFMLILASAWILWTAAAAPLSAADGQPVIKFGFIERIRFESWDNAISLSDNDAAAGYGRFRTSVWAQWTPNAHIELNLRLTNEFRNYISPKGRKLLLNEVFFDNLFIRWKNAGGAPITLTAGRQNITMGEGFIIMDGNPGDGSRSLYFNALRADIALTEKQTLSVIVNHMPRTDNLLPILNEQNPVLIEQPETGAILYYAADFSGIKLDAYLLRKYFGWDLNAINAVDYNTLGARISAPLWGSLSGTAELAVQSGEHNNSSRNALGGYFHLDYRFKETIPALRSLTVGGICLSGDDPATANQNEGWDPVFSRWPKWSESFIYTMLREKATAYWSNFTSLYLSGTFNIAKDLDAILTWHRLGAPRVRPQAFPGGAGKNRGDLFIGRINFRINPQTTGHLIWEHFRPGDYYFKDAKYANWVRFELLFQI